MRKCFFLGDRLVFANIMPALETAVELHITEYGVKEFVVGNYGAFNRMAAKAVIAAKESHPDITLTLLYPYRRLGKSIAPLKFDAVSFPPIVRKVPHRLAIIEASCHVIRCAEYMIVYTRHPTKAVKGLLQHAWGKEIQVTCLK